MPRRRCHKEGRSQVLCGPPTSSGQVHTRLARACSNCLCICRVREVHLLAAYSLRPSNVLTSVHAAQADKVVTYKVALNHFGKNSDVPFWKMVAEMEDLLLRASKDASLEPRIYYTRMPTFATPCPLCSEDNIRCYKVPAERGKRTSHKCVRCFNHGQRCAPNGK